MSVCSIDVAAVVGAVRFDPQTNYLNPCPGRPLRGITGNYRPGDSRPGPQDEEIERLASQGPGADR